MKSVENFVAETVLVESSLEELCKTQYSLKYFFRSHIDHQTYDKTLNYVKKGNIFWRENSEAALSNIRVNARMSNIMTFGLCQKICVNRA